MVHEFHFVMNQYMKERLLESDAYERSGSLSGSIRIIIGLLEPVVWREHQWGIQRESRYLSVKNDAGDIINDMHIYISEPDYRQLKMLHHDLNFFSIAQLVRFIIGIYLELSDLYGERLESELANLFMKWRKEEKAQKKGKFAVLRQLFQFYMKMPWNQRVFTLYNHHYSPFRVFRL